MVSRIAFPPPLLVLGAMLFVACQDSPVALPATRPALAVSLLERGESSSETTFDFTTIDDATKNVLRLRTASLQTSPTAKAVRALERELELDKDTLRYTLRMSTDADPPKWHLAAELHRTS